MRADAQRNRARVLKAAEAVFAEKGTSASTEEIALLAGVGIGTVFRHFPTKEALLEAVLMDHVAQIGEMAQNLAVSADPGAALFGLFSRMVEQSAKKKTYVDALADAGLDSRIARSQIGQETVMGLSALLVRAQQAGAVRDDIDVTDLIALVVGASRAVEYASSDHAVQERTLRVILSGLRPPDQSSGSEGKRSRARRRDQ
jgi:AcrR family transcriptional regulator